MSVIEIEALVLLNKLDSRDAVRQICEDAYTGRKNSTYPEHVVKRTCTATHVDNNQQAIKLLHSTYSLATRCLRSNYENSDQAVQGLQCDKDLAQILTFLLPLWQSLALKQMISPPRLVDFSAQVCSKSEVSENCASQASCVLNLTLEENGEQEQLCVELSKSKMSSVVADLGRVRDQLALIAGHK